MGRAKQGARSATLAAPSATRVLTLGRNSADRLARLGQATGKRRCSAHIVAVHPPSVRPQASTPAAAGSDRSSIPGRPPLRSVHRWLPVAEGLLFSKR